MCKLTAIVLFFLVVSTGSTLAQQSAKIKKLPVSNRLSSKIIDVKHIAVDLKFDWQKKQAIGTAVITLSALKATDKIFLDAGMLGINRIALSNGTYLKFNYDGGDNNAGLEITLDKMYMVNEDVKIKIDYHTNYINESDPNAIGGSFGKGLRFFVPTQSTPIKRKQIWSMGEAEGNKYWFPCSESPDDLRTTEFIATVDEKLTVISNGNLINTRQNTDGTKTFHYKTDKPYPNYLTSFVAGEYVNVKQHYKGIPFSTFCYPDEKKAAAATTARLTDMAKFFSTVTGLKYPYPGYSQVMVQDFPFPSLVGQHMATTISDNMIDDDRTHADFLYLWDGVEADALASQWFGNAIAAKDWSNIWLTKSLAHYLDGMYAEYKNGHDEYLMWYHSFDMAATLGDWSAGIHHPLVVRKIDNLNNFLSGDNYLKSRGTLVLRMLARELGIEKWKSVIQHFVKNNVYKAVSTNNFQQSVKAVTGDKMDWFFNQWIYKTGQPKFEVSKTYDAAKKQLFLKIIQTQKSDTTKLYPQADYFKGKMEIEIDGKIETVTINAKAENNFSINVSNPPKFVNVDFENSWIGEMKMEKSQQEWLYQFENSKDVLAKINALNELVTIYKNAATALKDKNIIYHSLLKVADSKSYWRFRINVLAALNGMLAKPFDAQMITLLQKIIKNEKALLKANAVWVLGNAGNPGFADIFINQLNDISDRVIFNAATALGKTKSLKAFDALVKLKNKPSWKGQSVMAALTGMRLLGDERAVPIALQVLADVKSPRWFLGPGNWDYPVYAAQTLASFNKGSEGYSMIFERFKKSVEDNDINDIFSNVLLITTLACPRGQEVFDLLKVKYKDDANAMLAVNQYETQFKEAVKK